MLDMVVGGILRSVDLVVSPEEGGLPASMVEEISMVVALRTTTSDCGLTQGLASMLMVGRTLVVPVMVGIAITTRAEVLPAVTMAVFIMGIRGIEEGGTSEGLR